MQRDGIVGLLVSEEDVKRGVYREIVSQSILKRQRRIIFETFRSLFTGAKRFRLAAPVQELRREMFLRLV
jgi:hypothetical protein